ncbi:5-formyltetrahydrofolate cyclo-ligase [Pseudogracilibacillus sp. ICA-222130]|uniref:5-formyltetrahydrofolate cyclo-ligase n=1 Tax=Pseudogracilibacillus sp. ICA-222130 TaxID=3134655 RepID=UPI0030BF2AC9
MKQTIRTNMIEKLSLLSKEEKKAIETSLLEQFKKSNLWIKPTTIGITISHRFEWETRNIIQFLWEKGKRVVVPKVHTDDKSMQFYELKNFAHVTKGHANILEPNTSLTTPVAQEDIELLIVPGIVFNVAGYRIGFGGGYYDRFLMKYDKTTVSFASEQQLRKDLPVEAHDIPVQYIVTEDKVWKTLSV